MNRRSFLTLAGSAMAAMAFRLPAGPVLTVSEVITWDKFLSLWALEASPVHLVAGQESVIQEVLDWYRNHAAV
jgi:hypothetical protein